MIRSIRLVMVVGVLVASSSVTALLVGFGEPSPFARSAPAQSLQTLPLSFIENRGQVDARASYYLRGAGASVYFTPRGLALSVGLGGPSTELAVEFPGADVTAPTGEGKAVGVASSFVGERGQWMTGVPTYSQVAYRELWDGIDLVYSGTSSRLKYRFEVEPGADPGRIGLTWSGVEDMAVNEAGQLELKTPSGSLIDDTPYTYQVIRGRKVEVPSRYRVSGRSVGFALGDHDPSRPVVIDPALLLYAGYVGGSAFEDGRGITIDGSGNAYVTGATGSDQTTFPDGDPDTNDAFPVPGPDQTYNANTDAYVAKVNATGTALVYAGYIGGGGADGGRGIAVDGAGNAYVTGGTSSDQTTFPDGDGFGAIPGFDQSHNGGIDAFVAKLNAAGTSLVYAGYIGGSGFDRAQVLRVDGSGNAYVTGRTESTQATFPDGDGFGAIPGPDQTHNGNVDAFVAKVNAAGTALVYAGYIGGSSNDQGFGIAPDGSGGAAVAGFADSDQTTFPDGDPNMNDAFPVPGHDQTHNGARDAFVARINPAGTALTSAGYIGGSLDDNGFGVAMDGFGNSYVIGSTSSTQATFPDGDGFGTLPGPDQTHNGLNDAFVATVNAAGSGFVYAGYIGGSGGDVAFGVAVDGSGAAYVTGETHSNQTTFPDGDGFGAIPGPDQTHNGMADAFVAKVGSGGSALVYAGYIGGSQSDIGTEVLVDTAGNAHVVGTTQSDQATFPDGDGFGTLPAFDQTFNGSGDAFVAKVEAFSLPQPLPPRCKGKPATIVGTNGNDTLNGTAQSDVVVALKGNDIIRTKGGNDTVCAGAGKDRASGGGGKDLLKGEKGKDRLRGQGGNDRLRGGPGRDTCHGGPGVDRAACEKERKVP